jgi:hypothetical protein
VLVVAVVVVFVALVALFSWRDVGRRMGIRACCGARPWPPDDLTGAVGDARPHAPDQTQGSWRRRAGDGDRHAVAIGAERDPDGEAGAARLRLPGPQR